MKAASEQLLSQQSQLDSGSREVERLQQQHDADKQATGDQILRQQENLKRLQQDLADAATAATTTKQVRLSTNLAFMWYPHFGVLCCSIASLVRKECMLSSYVHGKNLLHKGLCKDAGLLFVPDCILHLTCACPVFSPMSRKTVG